MFSATLFSKNAHQGIEKIAYEEWLITCDLFNYFRSIAKENRVVYEERFANFTSITEGLRVKSVNDIIIMLDEANKRFGAGRVTNRYAGLLKKMQPEIEKYGPSFFIHYFTNIDWHAPSINRLNLFNLGIPYQAVYQRHKQFIDHMLTSFTTAIDVYIKDTAQEIDMHRHRLNYYKPRDHETFIRSGIRILQKKIMHPILKVEFNEKLSRKKIRLLENLKGDLQELMEDSSQQDNINGFITGMCFLLKVCRDWNKTIVEQEKYSSLGEVDQILSHTIDWLLYYYPTEMATAQGWYETYLQENKVEFQQSPYYYP